MHTSRHAVHTAVLPLSPRTATRVIFAVVISLFSVLATTIVPASAATLPPTQPAKSKVFVRVDNVGGYLPLEYTYTLTPSTLLVDTKLYRPGAVALIYPGPAVLPIEERIVSANSATARARAIYAALVTPRGGWGVPAVADAPSAVVTVTVDGKTRTATVPSFGFNTAGNGVTSAQAAARMKLQGALNGLDVLKGSPRMYRPVNLEAWVLGDGRWDDPGMPSMNPSEPLPWPATATDNNGCNPIPARLLPAGANQASTFTANGRVFRAVFRPVLPGETACKRVR